MAKKEDGGPAYPGEQSPDAEAVKALRDVTGFGLRDCGRLLSKHGGMSLRDHFAGQALAALISRPITDYPDPSDLPTIEDHAEDAYAFADAMLAERAK